MKSCLSVVRRGDVALLLLALWALPWNLATCGAPAWWSSGWPRKHVRSTAEAELLSQIGVLMMPDEPIRELFRRFPIEATRDWISSHVDPDMTVHGVLKTTDAALFIEYDGSFSYKKQHKLHVDARKTAALLAFAPEGSQVLRISHNPVEEEVGVLQIVVDKWQHGDARSALSTVSQVLQGIISGMGATLQESVVHQVASRLAAAQLSSEALKYVDQIRILLPVDKAEIPCLGQKQLKAPIHEDGASEIVDRVKSLEALIGNCDNSQEWRTNMFVDIDDAAAMVLFRAASALVPCFGQVSGSSSSKKIGDAVQQVAAQIVCQAWEILEPRFESLMRAVVQEMPQLRGRLKVGADVTLRRSMSPALGARQDYPGAHSDSWDGTILGMALVSTKLGTRVYPEAEFPYPIGMFLSQSRTGARDAHQLDMDALGPLRTATPGSILVMPAAVAHSQPTQEDFENDVSKTTPRWFCRANMRIAISDGFRHGRTKEAREERLSLALLAAEHVWGDPAFASAAQALALLRRCDWEDESERELAT